MKLEILSITAIITLVASLVFIDGAFEELSSSRADKINAVISGPANDKPGYPEKQPAQKVEFNLDASGRPVMSFNIKDGRFTLDYVRALALPSDLQKGPFDVYFPLPFPHTLSGHETMRQKYASVCFNHKVYVCYRASLLNR